MIPGVTLTLKKKGPDSRCVDVAKDDAAVTAQAQSFATACNDLVSFINDQASAAREGKAGISRDPLVRGLRDRYAAS